MRSLVHVAASVLCANSSPPVGSIREAALRLVATLSIALKPSSLASSLRSIPLPHLPPTLDSAQMLSVSVSNFWSLPLFSASVGTREEVASLHVAILRLMDGGTPASRSFIVRTIAESMRLYEGQFHLTLREYGFKHTAIDSADDDAIRCNKLSGLAAFASNYLHLAAQADFCSLDVPILANLFQTVTQLVNACPSSVWASSEEPLSPISLRARLQCSMRAFVECGILSRILVRIVSGDQASVMDACNRCSAKHVQDLSTLSTSPTSAVESSGISDDEHTAFVPKTVAPATSTLESESLIASDQHFPDAENAFETSILTSFLTQIGRSDNVNATVALLSLFAAILSRVKLCRFTLLNSLTLKNASTTLVTWSFLHLIMHQRYQLALAEGDGYGPSHTQSSSLTGRLIKSASAAAASEPSSAWDRFLNIFRDDSPKSTSIVVPHSPASHHSDSLTHWYLQSSAVNHVPPTFASSSSVATSQRIPPFNPYATLSTATSFLEARSMNWLLLSSWPLSAHSSASPFTSSVSWASMCDTLFVALSIFSHALLIVDEDEFRTRLRPITLAQLPQWTELLKFVAFHLVWNNADVSSSSSPTSAAASNFVWQGDGCTTSDLLDACQRVLRELHQRDAVHGFMAVGSDATRASSWVLPEAFVRLWRSEYSDHSPRALYLLRQLPFLLPFALRVDLFSSWARSKRSSGNARAGGGNETRIVVRRRALVQDGFEALRRMGSRFDGVVRVVFLGDDDVPEEGVDLGGPFKEFLELLTNDLFKNAYGLFLATADGLLYPNSSTLIPQFEDLMEFVGKLIGKALSEGILVNAHFAPFFLNKIMGRASSLSSLASYDAQLYRSLLQVKNYSGQVADLALSFSVTEESFGHMTEVELKAGGANIEVTNANVVEYVYLCADYHLNRKIARASAAFRRGLASIIDRQWLSIFDCAELQRLIAGNDAPIDVAEWRAHTVYDQRTDASNGPDHRVVRWFWRAVAELEPAQHAKLLRFATAVERPPLNGFAHLNPPFTIRLVPLTGADGSANERSLWTRFVDFVGPSSSSPAAGALPSAATCFNMLKLPLYTDYDVLREKLLVAIENNAGFGSA
jgi:hypothetical protein